LTRVRAITQDDGHLFCRKNQIKDEVKMITDIIKEFYGTLGMLNDYRVSLSVRGEERNKYLGSDEVREIAEESLEAAAKANELPYKRVEGEAAFYGPKLDFMFKDCLGRQWQLATIQCDFNLPERFGLEFVNEQGEKERPVVIHRAISGSFERFMGILIEHFAGAFPLWLAPEQVRIIPVADAFMSYAQQVAEQLKGQQFRVSIDDDSNSFGKKIRNAEIRKVPYILIIGEKEEKADSVSVREFKTKEQYELGKKEFVEKISVIRDERRL
jgi:threonyl-tRNA synthetase